MTNRREKKKQTTRKKILEIASALFLENGYEAVSIAEIAAQADLGTGTVYNYFRSKDAVFLASMGNRFEPEKGFENLPEPECPGDILPIIRKCFEEVAAMLAYFPKSTYKEMMRALYSEKSSTELYNGMRQMDAQYIDDLCKLLEGYCEKGFLKKGFNSLYTSEMIHSLTESEFTYGYYLSDNPMDEVLNRVCGKINYLLEPWLNTDEFITTKRKPSHA